MDAARSRHLGAPVLREGAGAVKLSPPWRTPMQRLALCVLACTALPASVLPASALAQTPPAILGNEYVPAPWRMHDPVIASMGFVRVELPANRAGFTANFQVVERSSAEATTKAADKVRTLAK